MKSTKEEAVIDWLFLILVSVLLVLCLFASYSDAQKLQVVPLRLIVVERADISNQEQINLFMEGVSRFAEVGTYIKIIDTQVVPDVLKVNGYPQYWGRLFAWHEWAIKKKRTTNKVLTHFLLPPVLWNGTSYQGGVAGAICTTDRRNSKRKFSYSIMRAKNDQGQDRKEQSRIAAMHELLHNFGAQHLDKQPNIMHSAAMNFGIPFKQFLLHPATKVDVNRCRADRALVARRRVSVIAEPLFK